MSSNLRDRRFAGEPSPLPQYEAPSPSAAILDGGTVLLAADRGLRTLDRQLGRVITASYTTLELA
jgi:hypothetical protein